MLRRRTGILWAAGTTAVLIGLVGTVILVRFLRGPDLSDPVAGVTTVRLGESSFSPAAIRVPSGTAVTWRWDGGIMHNITGDGFASPDQSAGEYAITFTEPGDYRVRCTLHFRMKGRVLVE